MARGDNILLNGIIFLSVGWICCFIISTFTYYRSFPASISLCFTSSGRPTCDGRLPSAWSMRSRMSIFSMPFSGFISELACASKFCRYRLESDAFFGLVLSANRTNSILFWMILCLLCLISSSDIWLIVCRTVCRRVLISSLRASVGPRGVCMGTVSGISIWLSLKASICSMCLRCLFYYMALVLLVEMEGRHMALLDLFLRMNFYSSSAMSSSIILIRWRMRNRT